MPRRPRLSLAAMPFHLIQRGNNRGACFFAESDYTFYLNELKAACQAHRASLHAYCLMTNHVHLLLTPAEADGPSLVMKRLGQRYVQYVNRTHGRSGTLWEGRFRSCPVGEEAYLFACARYIESNPVRANMVAQPADYRWSSYRANALGQPDPSVTPHELYEALGSTPEARLSAYRELFRQYPDQSQIEEIRSATNGGFALGSETFQQHIANLTGRRTWRGHPGRPASREVGQVV
ncbi:transposase [Skermanella aerolata]|nr:transposase [Skermanella aerolata]KJB91109.1 transposase IS200 [Skermanella aerolata KACC 11604]